MTYKEFIRRRDNIATSAAPIAVKEMAMKRLEQEFMTKEATEKAIMQIEESKAEGIPVDE